MINGRDMVVAIIVAAVTLSVSAFAHSEAKVMSLSVFDWNIIPVSQTESAFVRRCFQTSTTTLDELECHVTTLDPVESPHPRQAFESSLNLLRDSISCLCCVGITQEVATNSTFIEHFVAINS